MNDFAAVELEPWLIVQGDADQTRLALWRFAQGGDESLAVFSDRSQAEAYARVHCARPWHVSQFAKTQLISVLAECFRHGIRHAVLDPSDSSARQVFVLRDVLQAAKLHLQTYKQ